MTAEPVLETAPRYMMHILAFALGLVTGSFVCVAADRLPVHEDVICARSHCTSCGHALSAPDLVPVLSYAASKGRCRYCGARLSLRYPLMELMCGILCLLSSMACQRWAQAAICCAAAPAMFCAVTMHIEGSGVPMGCSVAMGILGMASAASGPEGPWPHAAGLIAMCLVAAAMRGHMDAGTRAMLPAAGLFLGLRGMALAALAASALWTAPYLADMALKRHRGKPAAGACLLAGIALALPYAP